MGGNVRSETAQYDIVQAFNYLDLIVKVNNGIDGGWEPFGNVVIEKAVNYTSYYQPMIYRGGE
jgi:hypothetical protein